MSGYEEILEFWFDPEHVAYHFEYNEEFDKELRENFYKTWEDASQGLLVGWRKNIYGRLAEIIVLDQFSRNFFREDKQAYLQDDMALILAQEAVLHEDFESLSSAQKQFILMPFMHSESVKIHKWAQPLFEKYGGEGTNHFEDKHFDMIKEFGRYPYRNKALGRKNTEKEQAGYEKEW